MYSVGIDVVVLKHGWVRQYISKAEWLCIHF